MLCCTRGPGLPLLGPQHPLSTVQMAQGPLQLQSSRPPPSFGCPPCNPRPSPPPRASSPAGAMATESARPWQPKEPPRRVPGSDWRGVQQAQTSKPSVPLAAASPGSAPGWGGGRTQNGFSEPSGQGAGGPRPCGLTHQHAAFPQQPRVHTWGRGS